MKKLTLTVFCLLLAAPSFALTGISFGIRGGTVSDYEQAGLAIGDFGADKMNLASAQIRIGTLPMVDFIVSGNYAWKNKKYDFAGNTFELKMHDLSFDASMVYPMRFQFFSPYLGGGVGTHSLSFDYIKPLSLSLSESGIAVPESVSRLGYHLVAGVNIGIPAFPFGLSAEYRMNWIDTPGEVTKYNSLTAGIDFKLP